MWRSLLATAFLNFYAFSKMRLEDPFAYCRAAWKTLHLTGVEVFRSQSSPDGEFVAKLVENPDFFREQVLLFHTSLPSEWHLNND